MYIGVYFVSAQDYKNRPNPFPGVCRRRWPNLAVSSARCDVIIHLVLMPWCQSVCLSVTFVHCVYRVWWIPDIFACLDRWMSLLLTDNAWPGSSDGMMPGFLVEEGGMEKVVIVAISLVLLIFLSMDRNDVTYLFTWKILKLFIITSHLLHVPKLPKTISILSLIKQFI